jgi:hypothetical protein
MGGTCILRLVQNYAGFSEVARGVKLDIFGIVVTIGKAFQQSQNNKCTINIIYQTSVLDKPQ